MLKDYAQEALRIVLSVKLEALQKKNASFSLRAFARKVGMDASSLQQFLSGKRKISKKVALRICSTPLLDQKQKRQITSLLSSTLAPPATKRVASDQFKWMADWHFFAILSLIKTDDFQSNSLWIANRLGISKKAATHALQTLARLNLIQKDSHQRWVRTENSLNTCDEMPDHFIQTFHRQTLDLAKKSISQVPTHLRDITSVTLAIDPKDLPHAKKLIRKFEDEFDSIFESSAQHKSEVYHLTVSFFPLTQLNREAQHP